MATPHPLVSIITVCLNERTRIEKTINSITHQKCQEFEWIVIDGGSTDGTLDILNMHRDRMRVFVSEKDQGVYHAMNKGIRLAQGEYCLFMNGGDEFYDPHAIDKFHSFDNKADYNYGGIVEVRGDDRIPNHIDPISNLRHFLYKRSLPHQASFIRTELFKKYGGYDTAFEVLADQEFCKRMILKHKVKVRHLPWMVAVFYFDGLTFKSKKLAPLELEKKTIRNMYFGYGYRLRYALNAGIGKLINCKKYLIDSI